jgi:hypothetical protein
LIPSTLRRIFCTLSLNANTADHDAHRTAVVEAFESEAPSAITDRIALADTNTPTDEQGRSRAG